MILSGYWPEPETTDFCYNDYNQMKKWAIHVSCRSYRSKDSALFDDVTPVDFTEVLWSMMEFSYVPNVSGLAEREYFIQDKHFYLKVAAWNPWVSELWPPSNKNISHYMGKLCAGKFTWWISSSSRKIFGCMVSWTQLVDCFSQDPFIPSEHPSILRRLYKKESPPTIVIAIQKESGYTLFRSASPEVSDLYVHSERNPSREMKKVFQSAAKDRGIDMNLDEEWYLLFTWDSLSEVSCPHEILKITAEKNIEMGFQVPEILMGTTARLFQAACARDSESSITGTFATAIHSWNEHIKSSFETYVHVKDAEEGPVWLEGYTENYLTFGFLDFLTRTLFVLNAPEDEVRPLHHEVLMPTEQDFKRETLKASKDAPEDIQLIAEELFGVGPTLNDRRAPEDHEKASFVISGGFTNTFVGFAVEPYVCTVAKRRGYWCTKVLCKNKKMQIVFTSQENAPRIAQRSTNLTDYDAVGLVRPGKDNCEFVLSISEELSQEEAKSPCLSKDMQDTFSRAETSLRLSDAKLPWRRLEVWLIDGTYCVDTDQDVVSYTCATKISERNEK